MPPSASAEPSGRRPAADGVRELLPHIQLRKLVDKLPAILYVSETGIDGRWLYVSRGIESILGFSPDQWVQDSGLWARQVHPDDRARVFDRESALNEPTSPDAYRMLHRDGHTVWVRDEAALVHDAQGNVCWHGVLENEASEATAVAVAERLVCAFEPPFQRRAGEHFAKVSVGVALAGRRGRTAAGLIRDADAAL